MYEVCMCVTVGGFGVCRFGGCKITTNSIRA